MAFFVYFFVVFNHNEVLLGGQKSLESGDLGRRGDEISRAKPMALLCASQGGAYLAARRVFFLKISS